MENNDFKLTPSDYCILMEIELTDFLSSRSRQISLLRQLYWYYIRSTAPQIRLRQIADLFNVNHSTILFGVKRIDGLIKIKDKEIVELWNKIIVIKNKKE